MTTILVTGANGQLGNEMRQVCSNCLDYNYIFTDIDELDITNLNNILKIVKEQHIQVIVNCATYTNIDKAEDEPDVANILNHIAVGYLATAAKVENATLIIPYWRDSLMKCINELKLNS